MKKAKSSKTPEPKPESIFDQEPELVFQGLAYRDGKKLSADGLERVLKRVALLPMPQEGDGFVSRDRNRRILMRLLHAAKERAYGDEGRIKVEFEIDAADYGHLCEAMVRRGLKTPQEAMDWFLSTGALVDWLNEGCPERFDEWAIRQEAIEEAKAKA